MILIHRPGEHFLQYKCVICIFTKNSFPALRLPLGFDICAQWHHVKGEFFLMTRVCSIFEFETGRN
jgi:hypothetical protein